MAQGFHYIGTAADGFRLTRYSANHVRPSYTHAVRLVGMTGGGSFCGSLALAQAAAGSAHRVACRVASRAGRPEPRFPEIVELVAAPGRLPVGSTFR